MTPTVTPDIASLPILILAPHSRCNCRCVMCDIWKDTTSASLSPTDLARHISDIEKLGVQWVVFSGGEPLMHADLFEFCESLRALHIRLTLLSTGLLLERYASAIASHFDEVIVSLDGPPALHDLIRRVPGAFSSLQKGIRALHSIQPGLPVRARCTVQKANHSSLTETVAAASGLNLQSISFLAADITSEAFNRPDGWSARKQAEIALSDEQTSVLARQFDEIASRWEGSAYVVETREKLQRIVDHFRAHLGLCEAIAPACNAPWVSAVIEADATVKPCFFHPSIGSLKDHGLLEILNGSRAISFRQSLDVKTNGTCKRCVCSLNWRARADPL